MKNPFTTTFSKLPEYTYIATSKTDEILENFSYDLPSESVYKITGVRGSGKTVILAKIEETLREQAGWIVIDLNPTRDVLGQIAALLHKEGYGASNVKARSANVSATVLGTGAQLGFSKESENPYFDIGIEVEEMIKESVRDSKKILIGIDEISKTEEMVVFTSEYGRWLRAGYPVYLVCTGLYENINDLSNVKNLTFFRRATTIQTEPLNLVRMTEMYRKFLEVNQEEALLLAKMTRGYAYAFQELGVIYFKNNKSMPLEDLTMDLKAELFAYSYEKIWEELSPSDRFLVKILSSKDDLKREEILQLMGDKSANYSVYRDRLLRRGIIGVTKYGHVSLVLPYFSEYVKEYCLER